MSRACGGCGLINEGDTSAPDAACPECGTPYRRASHNLKSQRRTDDTPENLNKARKAVAAKRADAEKRGIFRYVVFAVIAACAWFVYSAMKPSDDRPAASQSRQPKPCDRADAHCIAQDIIATIQAPCTRAVEAKLKYIPTWTDGTFDWRFGSPMWYDPPRTLIFHGNFLVATNGFGAKSKASYFCVTSTSGTVLKAEIHDLP